MIVWLRSNVGFSPFLDDSLFSEGEIVVDKLKVFFSILFSKHFFHGDEYFAFLSHLLLFWAEFLDFLLFFFSFLWWFLGFLLRDFLLALFLHFLWASSLFFLFFVTFWFIITSAVIFFELLEFFIIKLNYFFFMKLLKDLPNIHIRILFNIRWSFFNWNV